MTLSRPLLAILISFALACAGFAQSAKSAKPKNYPAIIKASPQRLSQVERDWQRLLEVYKVKESQPEFYSITYTPRSFLNLQGAIKLLETVPQPQTDVTIAIREAAKRFIERWRDLLSAEPAMISLTSAESSNDGHRLSYRQANYPFPIAGRFGELTLVISNDGRIMQLDDRFIPLVELPFKPAIDRQAAAQKLVGRTFTYKDPAGRDQQTKINGLNEVNVKGLVVLPIEKKDALEVHLAWEIVIGTASPWTIYVDAIDGGDLKTEQNFNT
jgi:hypothetical protein